MNTSKAKESWPWVDVERRIDRNEPLHKSTVTFAYKISGVPSPSLCRKLFPYHMGARAWARGRPRKDPFEEAAEEMIVGSFGEFYEEEKARPRTRGDLAPSHSTLERLGAELNKSPESIRNIHYRKRKKMCN